VFSCLVQKSIFAKKKKQKKQKSRKAEKQKTKKHNYSFLLCNGCKNAFLLQLFAGPMRKAPLLLFIMQNPKPMFHARKPRLWLCKNTFLQHHK